jgi:hypothetical protein
LNTCFYQEPYKGARFEQAIPVKNVAISVNIRLTEKTKAEKPNLKN